MQYAYKKDGKGDRHGDQAERMLATEAKKHMIQPIGQPISAQLFIGSGPNGPAAIVDPDTSGLMGNIAVPPPISLLSSRPGPPAVNYSSPLHNPSYRPAPPSQPLPAPPSGLPARPPPSQAGYGGPQSFLSHGFNAQPPPGFGLPGGHSGLPPGFQANTAGNR